MGKQSALNYHAFQKNPQRSTLKRGEKGRDFNNQRQGRIVLGRQKNRFGDRKPHSNRSSDTKNRGKNIPEKKGGGKRGHRKEQNPKGLDGTSNQDCLTAPA